MTNNEEWEAIQRKLVAIRDCDGESCQDCKWSFEWIKDTFEEAERRGYERGKIDTLKHWHGVGEIALYESDINSCPDLPWFVGEIKMDLDRESKKIGPRS